MYRYIAKVTLRIALIAPIIIYVAIAWGLHQKYLEEYAKWNKSERVFHCLSKLPNEKLRSIENAYGNFDAREFGCIFRAEPFWTNISEVRGQRFFKDPPDYWTNATYHLEIIPLVAFAVILGGALLAVCIWVICWTFGISSSSRNVLHVNAWITAIVTGTISAVIAGIILAKIL